MEFISGRSEVFCSQGEPKLWPMTSMWTDKDVHDFVCDIGFGKYAQCFRDHAVNGKRLLGITPFELQRMGVKNMQDALRLHASIKATTNRMTYNMEDVDRPPNVSYSSTTKGRIVYNPKLPPSLQPENSSAFHPGMPPLPGHPYDIDLRGLCLPFRRTVDRLPRTQTCRSFQIGEFSPLSHTRDKWALYNSHILNG
ncbi:hypothetical protein EGW08_018422 [Elysia chlorotica]|uniref:SAM domain-containing protein n=1 Tax=Elysia chlorotica TaxID=188477 RepID=A0A3S1B7B1_ELYCH|nr:hypothetical protein EGW08_018422 [Elysia chlorotica]